MPTRRNGVRRVGVSTDPGVCEPQTPPTTRGGGSPGRRRRDRRLFPARQGPVLGAAARVIPGPAQPLAVGLRACAGRARLPTRDRPAGVVRRLRHHDRLGLTRLGNPSRCVGGPCDPGCRMNSETRIVGDTKQTPTGVAARSLGVSESRLAAVSTALNRPAVAAVGAALAQRAGRRLRADARWRYGEGRADVEHRRDHGRRRRRPHLRDGPGPGRRHRRPRGRGARAPGGVAGQARGVHHRRPADRAAPGVPGVGRGDDEHGVAVPVRPVHRRGGRPGHQPDPLGRRRGVPRRPAAAQPRVGDRRPQRPRLARHERGSWPRPGWRRPRVCCAWVLRAPARASSRGSSPTRRRAGRRC